MVASWTYNLYDFEAVKMSFITTCMHSSCIDPSPCLLNGVQVLGRLSPDGLKVAPIGCAPGHWLDGIGPYVFTEQGSMQLSVPTDFYSRKAQAVVQAGDKTGSSTAVQPQLDPQAQSQTQAAETPQSHGYGLSRDKIWVQWDRQKTLWLPPDYRPCTLAISPSSATIALGCRSGRVLVGFEASDVSTTYPWSLMAWRDPSAIWRSSSFGYVNSTFQVVSGVSVSDESFQLYLKIQAMD
ncbi:hypothetical protein B0T10DRAFT_565143 [Thelonectria olida]|uniref:Uncharacterized protein n=1 Tax=Thelonectria olida TaxID=1576542 RepID=A0A9P8VX55_9HYPO|nr:hypothetical protein B0T10DRAFT_565143 [Thelonectria olida]